MQLSVVTGDEGRLGDLYVCVHLQEAMETLITLFAKLKPYFTTVLHSTWDIKQDKPTYLCLSPTTLCKVNRMSQ